MSGYVCNRCGWTDDQARANGCIHGPCPMRPVSLNARLRPYGWSVGLIVYLAVPCLLVGAGCIYLLLS
jgi:hypothetical protein